MRNKSHHNLFDQTKQFKFSFFHHDCFFLFYFPFSTGKCFQNRINMNIYLYFSIHTQLNTLWLLLLHVSLCFIFYFFVLLSIWFHLYKWSHIQWKKDTTVVASHSKTDKILYIYVNDNRKQTMADWLHKLMWMKTFFNCWWCLLLVCCFLCCSNENFCTGLEKTMGTFAFCTNHCPASNRL